MNSSDAAPDGLNPAEVREMLELGRSGLFSTLEESAKRLTAPFFWYSADPDSSSNPVVGGTMCFVRTSVRVLGISAAHVHRDCVKALSASSDMACQLGAHTFTPQDHIVDIDDALDIVTYDLSEIQVTAARAYAHAPAVWPPPPPRNADYAVAAGWPWNLSAQETTRFSHQFLHFIGRFNIDGVRQIGMATHRSHSVPWGQRSLPPGLNLGGMSGGPLFALRTDGLMRLELVGVISDFIQSIEQVLARPVDLIALDGTLVRSSAL